MRENTIWLEVSDNTLMSCEETKYIVEKLLAAKRKQLVRLKVDSCGGRIAYAFAIVHAMHKCKAKIATSIFKAQSSALPIALAGDAYLFYATDQPEALCAHVPRWGIGNLEPEEFSYVMAIDKIEWSVGELVYKVKSPSDWGWSSSIDYYATVMKKYVYPFLSEEEIRRYENGEDVYLDTNGIWERISNVLKMQKRTGLTDRLLEEFN